MEEQLLKAISNLGEMATINSNNQLLSDIKFKAKAMIPLVKQMEEHNEHLDFPEEEMERLNNLIHDVKQRPRHARTLRLLDSALKNFMEALALRMAIGQTLNLKSIKDDADEISRRLDRIDYGYAKRGEEWGLGIGIFISFTCFCIYCLI